MIGGNYRLFLGDLSVSCIKEDLIRLLSPFGTITDVQIKQDAVTGKKLCYGFVDFDNIKSALDVLNSMNGYVLFGRPLRIRWANSKVKTANAQTNDGALAFSSTSVHVSYCSVLNEFVIVTEESLRSLFGTCGTVVDVMIKKSYRHVCPDCFCDDMESAVNAISSLNNVTVDGVLYKVGLSIDMQKKLNSVVYSAYYSPSQPDFCQPPMQPVYAQALPPSASSTGISSAFPMVPSGDDGSLTFSYHPVYYAPASQAVVLQPVYYAQDNYVPPVAMSSAASYAVMSRKDDHAGAYCNYNISSGQLA